MAYVKQTWANEILTNPDVRFTIKQDNGTIINDDVDIVLKTPVETQGTPVTAERMLHIEQGIYDATKDFETVTTNIKPAGTASVGVLDTVARADHVHPIEDTGWIAPTLLSDWENFGAEFSIAGYRKIGSVVYLRGVLRNGSAASAIFFTLPSGYRPFYAQTLTSFSAAGPCRIDIYPDGGVYAVNNGSTTSTSLDGISFFLD